MIKIKITPEELPMIAMIIETVGQGLFASKIRRYLRDTINVTVVDSDNKFPIELDSWVALWVLSTLYLSQVDGPSASLMFKLEDALSANVEIIAEEQS